MKLGRWPDVIIGIYLQLYTCDSKREPHQFSMEKLRTTRSVPCVYELGQQLEKKRNRCTARTERSLSIVKRHSILSLVSLGSNFNCWTIRFPRVMAKYRANRWKCYDLQLVSTSETSFNYRWGEESFVRRVLWTFKENSTRNGHRRSLHGIDFNRLESAIYLVIVIYLLIYLLDGKSYVRKENNNHEIVDAKETMLQKRTHCITRLMWIWETDSH